MLECVGKKRRKKRKRKARKRTRVRKGIIKRVPTKTPPAEPIIPWLPPTPEIDMPAPKRRRAPDKSPFVYVAS